MFKKLSNPLNIIFFTALALVFLIIFGFLPRQVAFFVLALYLFYILFAKTQNGVSLFLRSIPFFIALPISESFDNFDMGRIILLVIFARWLVVDSGWLKKLRKHWGKEHILHFINIYKVEALGLAFFFLAFWSLFAAFDPIAGMRRMIFIANAALLFIVLRGLIIKNKETAQDFAKNFAYSGLLAVLFGYLQFFAAYFSEAYIFHYWWGQLISLNMYGREWANIVTNFGNTWFSYSGNTLRLRMFSVFPDSHSFPMYVIMTIPAMFVVFFNKLKEGISARIKWFYVFIFALVNLALVLSGTRGIWLASLATLLVIPGLKIHKIDKKFYKMIGVSFLIFILMFPLYFGIVSFRQFQETTFTSAASFARFRSLLDFGETSNQGRIYIWKETLISISERPFLGVGIGNYPTVLKEPQSAARAGASAHNLYLHIASTVGIPGLIIFLWMMWEVVKLSFQYIKQNADKVWAIYFVMFLYSLIWTGAYLMTDAALFDGRALLAFMAIMGISVGLYRNKNLKYDET